MFPAKLHVLRIGLMLVTWSCLHAQTQPPNDAFLLSGALEGLVVEAEADNSLATAEPGEPSHSGFAPVRSLWWTYRSSGYATVTVTATPALAPAQVAVYTGAAVDSLAPVPGTFLYSLNPGTAFRFVAVPNAEYRIAVESGDSVAGLVRLRVEAEPFEPMAPNFVTQPAGRSFRLGQNFDLTVAATGQPAVTYQWFRNDQPLPHATNRSLAFRNAVATNAGSYRVEAANLAGSVQSEPAVLQLMVLPEITQQPKAQTMSPRGTATFSVGATGASQSGYLWLKDGVPIPRANRSTLTVENVQAADVGLYSVRVANFYGLVTSEEAPLRLSSTPTAADEVLEIISAGGTTPVQETGAVYFQVRAVGAKPLTFQWFRDGQPLPGETDRELTFVANVDSGGTYSVLVTNLNASETRNFPLTVTPGGPPNDHFANRRPIAFEPSTSASSYLATSEPGEPLALAQARRTVWWTYRMPGDGQASIRAVSSTFSPVVSVFTGTALANLQLVTRTQTTSRDAGATVTFHGFAGEEFLVTLADMFGSHGSYSLTTSFVADPPSDLPPTIVQHPVSPAPVAAGTNVTLKVTATGAHELAYEWRREQTVLPGATGTTLILTNAQPTDSGSYTVRVSNANGSETSQPATVQVNPAAVQFAAKPPATVVVTAGYPVSLSARATGSTPMEFRWQHGDRPLPAGNGSTIRWRPSRVGGPTEVSLTVSNPLGSTSLPPTRVSVVPAGVRYRWTTLAGAAGVAERVDGRGSAARFDLPSGIAVDANGTILVAERNAVRRVTPDGEVTTLPSPALGFGVDVSVMPDGTVLVLDQGAAIHRLLGDGLAGQFSQSQGGWGMGVAPDGALWLPLGTTVRRVLLDGLQTTVATGMGNAVDVAFDSAGHAYVADASSYVIRRIDLGGQSSIYAGVRGTNGSLDGPAASALFGWPNSVSFDRAGNLYVADEFANTIRRISPDGAVTTVGGQSQRRGAADGVGQAARFAAPRRVVSTPEGILYVADTDSHTIRQGVPVSEDVPVLRATKTGREITVSWTPGDGLVWLERASRADTGAADWEPVDPLSDADQGSHLVPEGGGDSGFFRLRGP